jgi:hypothetical protein
MKSGLIYNNYPLPIGVKKNDEPLSFVPTVEAGGGS